MEYLHIYVFKESFGPIIKLLNMYDVKYQICEERSGAAMAASSVIEILQSAIMWGALATVIVTFLKSKNDRKVIITTKDNKIIHAEGINSKELEEILKQSKNLAAIDTNKNPDTANKSFFKK